MDSREAYLSIFASLGLRANPRVIEQLQTYVSLLKKWNTRINLIASNEWALIELLLQEGLWAAQMYPEDAETHLDVGSGAGFPAIPICIARADVRLDMVESRIKRVSFLETVSRSLEMSRIRVHHGRIEQFLERSSAVWDCVSWKAIKIKTKELERLREHSHKKTRFLVFHGKELAVEDPKAAERMMKLVSREKFPFRSEWTLSVYLPE